MVADAGQRLRCLTCSPSRRDLPWSQALVSVSSASWDGYLGVNPFAMVARYHSCDMTATSPSLATPLPHAHRLLRSHLRSLHSFPHSFINSSQHRSTTLLHYLLSSNIHLQSPQWQMVLLSSATTTKIRISCLGGAVRSAARAREWRGVVGCMMISAITPPFPSTFGCKTYNRLKDLTLCRAGVAGIS